MPVPTFANIVVYALQVAAIAAAAVTLPVVFGLAAPRARLLHLRIALIVAVTLPFVWSAVAPPTAPPALLRALEPLSRPPVAAAAPAPLAPEPDGRVPAVPALPYPAGLMVLAAICAGAAVRAAWVASGFGRLRRLRRCASPLEPRPAPIREAVALAAADAEIRVSRDVACPVSFGNRRPTVLLPEAVRDYPDDEQRAVTCHELIHVRRRDWLRAVGDEIVRAVFWFHPAIWWLLDEIDLAREQVVDQEVVALTGRRRPYLEALVKLARPTPRLALRPAASFLGREHLGERVTLLLKEAGMSKLRIVGGLAASTSLVLALAAVLAWVLPLEAAPRADGASATARAVASAVGPEAPAAGFQEAAPQKTPRVQAPKLRSSVKPVYPPEAKAKGIKGSVILEARIDTAGIVTDLKVLRSVAGLDQAAIDAVKQWRYEPLDKPVVFTVTIRFDPDAKPASKPGTAAQGSGTPRVREPKVVSSVKPVYPPEAKAKGVQGVVILEARIDATGTVTDVKVLRSVAGLDQAAVDALKQWRYEPLEKPVVFTVTMRFALDEKK